MNSQHKQLLQRGHDYAITLIAATYISTAVNETAFRFIARRASGSFLEISLINRGRSSDLVTISKRQVLAGFTDTCMLKGLRLITAMTSSMSHLDHGLINCLFLVRTSGGNVIYRANIWSRKLCIARRFYHVPVFT
jgi:hypothetical protein